MSGLIVPKPTHDAAYWARVTKAMDFTSEDKMDFAAYNRILWEGLMGGRAADDGRGQQRPVPHALQLWRAHRAVIVSRAGSDEREVTAAGTRALPR
jgi:hypothetical protein